MHRALELCNTMFMKQKQRYTERHSAHLKIRHLSETLDLLCTNGLQRYCHGYRF